MKPMEIRLSRRGQALALRGHGQPLFLTLCLIQFSAPATAWTQTATAEPGFAELANELDGAPQKSWNWSAYLRSRGELLHNLDLDRGLDPAGAPLYPVPPSGYGQALTHADLRLRTDFSLRTAHGGGAVLARIDWLDALAMGSAPLGAPAGSETQTAPPLASLRRAYGVIALPFGAAAMGRMNGHWGLGMASHGGDGLDANRSDATDRAAFVTPLAGHLWALAYDWSATGPQAFRPDSSRIIDLDPADDVKSATFAVLNVRSQLARERRQRAGLTTFEYGALASKRWQNRDAPATWAAETPPTRLSSSDWVARGLRAYAANAWTRASGPWGRVEAEAMVVSGQMDSASVLPGATLRQEVAIRQWGAALQSQFGDVANGFSAGLDAGAASGDAAPGIGAFASAAAPYGKPGTIAGAQIDPPRDNLASEFRMHPNYRVDRILFAEIRGAVVDAAYLRPHVQFVWPRAGNGQLRAQVAAVQSWAMQAASAPGQQRPLGLEIDPTLTYASRDGILAQLQYGVLLPQAGLDNPDAGLKGRPAQMLRLVLRWEL